MSFAKKVRRIVYTIADYATFPLRLLTRKSRKHGWSYRFRRRLRYGDDTSYIRAIRFLDGHGDIEDWGCGAGYAEKFVRRSRYRGIDGSPGYADAVVDLRTYRSKTPCLLLRHVLEHNAEWRSILANALSSFEARMVLVLFTPLGETTHVLTASQNGTPDISFSKADLLAFFGPDVEVEEESFPSRTKYGMETIFYLRKN